MSAAPWCGQPLPDDRDGWRTRALAFKESAEEAEADVKRLKEALRLVYGYAAAIQRMSVFVPIGFRCSLIRETVSRALSDAEARRLHDETEIILDTLTEPTSESPSWQRAEPC